MSDIFLSYKSEDRPRAKIIAEALERHGYSVWWDRIIPPGRTFDDVIEEELDASKCVVVLWSRESVKSKWVKTEASEGDSRGILVPVLIDNIKIPLEFRRIQAAQLIDWQGKLPDTEFDLFLRSVAHILGRSIEPKIEVNKISTGEPNISAQQLYEAEKYSEVIATRKKAKNEASENRIAIKAIRNVPDKENRKRIIELSSNAQKLFENKMYAEAIAKWQDVLDLDSENSKAIEGIEKARNKIESMKVYNFCQNCGYPNEDKLNYCTQCGANLYLIV